MKSILICHEDIPIDRVGVSSWLSSFTDLRGIIVLREIDERKKQRVKREIKRVGYIRFLDVLAFRLFYKLKFARKDSAWEKQEVADIVAKYGEKQNVPVLITASPNSDEAEKFLTLHSPDVIIARCKVLLSKRVYSLATIGTFVMHPGICPEYRNAHGCFWALVNNETDKVGMTLLKIDDGVDTGPIYGYFTYNYDSQAESHIKIQTRVVTENFDGIASKLTDIANNTAQPLDTSGRASGVWGHPWLSKYIKWKFLSVRGEA